MCRFAKRFATLTENRFFGFKSGSTDDIADIRLYILIALSTYMSFKVKYSMERIKDRQNNIKERFYWRFSMTSAIGEGLSLSGSMFDFESISESNLSSNWKLLLSFPAVLHCSRIHFSKRFINNSFHTHSYLGKIFVMAPISNYESKFSSNSSPIYSLKLRVMRKFKVFVINLLRLSNRRLFSKGTLNISQHQTVNTIIFYSSLPQNGIWHIITERWMDGPHCPGIKK